jgi:hypothetical protein
MNADNSLSFSIGVHLCLSAADLLCRKIPVAGCAGIAA